jgi:internalin A
MKPLKIKYVKHLFSLSHYQVDLEFIAKNFKGLEILNLSHTQITDAGVTHLASLTQLKKLWLAGNQITDISPLASLTQLQGLHLYNNQITDVSPVAPLTQLQILDLQKNAITDVPPFPSLRQLDLLWLSENPITDERLEQLATRLNMIKEEKKLTPKTFLLRKWFD